MVDVAPGANDSVRVLVGSRAGDVLVTDRMVEAVPVRLSRSVTLKLTV